MSINIVGISAWYHDAACCLLQDGALKAAAEEERFSRIKPDRLLPVKAFLTGEEAVAGSLEGLEWEGSCQPFPLYGRIQTFRARRAWAPRASPVRHWPEDVAGQLRAAPPA
jgi:hypothetical protein